MREISLEDWIQEGTALFGEDKLSWKFVCPICGNIASPQDFRRYADRGATASSACCECIGRYSAGRSALGESSQKRKPCDYAAYGLIPVCETTVVMEDGDAVPVFEFARGE